MPYSQTPSTCVSQSIWETKFQISTKIDNVIVFKIKLYFWARNRTTEHSGPNVKLSLSSICSSFLLECNFHLLVVFPKYLNFATFLKDLRHKHTLIFSAFMSILILLLVNSKPCLFFFIVVSYHSAN